MTIKEAHDKLNRWFPKRSHSIGVTYWHWQHSNTNRHEVQYSLSVHDPIVTVHNAPTLNDAIRQLRRKTTPAPLPPTQAQALAQADQAAQEMEEVASGR
uniref:Uncharacterized protein n=1 Tax=viral metagenome TaxID=1070528 RepID=A0A6M3LPK5_9ZZZZ